VEAFRERWNKDLKRLNVEDRLRELCTRLTTLYKEAEKKEKSITAAPLFTVHTAIVVLTPSSAHPEKRYHEERDYDEKQPAAYGSDNEFQPGRVVSHSSIMNFHFENICFRLQTFWEIWGIIFRDLVMIGPQLERVPAQEEFVETRLAKLRTQYSDLRDLLLGYAAGIDNAFPHAVHPRDSRMVTPSLSECSSCSTPAGDLSTKFVRMCNNLVNGLWKHFE